MTLLKYTATLGLFALLCACSNKSEEEKITDPDELYKTAVTSLSSSRYSEASEKFEQLEREHPTSNLAASAQVKRAYAKYLDEKFEEAVLIIEDFIKHYPANHATPYMFYLRGLCYYDQLLDVGRDQELSAQAHDAFQELIRRYPSTDYARDARLKLDYISNLVAGKEMEIGRFYLSKKETIAALNRFKTVIDKYETSIFTPEALYRLAEIYYALGDIAQAKVYISVLNYNYSGSNWAGMANNIIGSKQ